MTVEDLAIRSTGVLDAAVGMVDEGPGWRAMLDRHHQRVLAQRTPQMVGHAPADDLAGRHVLDGRQVQPALVSGHIRNIRQPDRIRPISFEGALEQVSRKLGLEVGARAGKNVRYLSFFILDRTRAHGFFL